MRFRYLVYESGIKLLFEMSGPRAGKVIWSSLDNDARLGGVYTVVPKARLGDGDFESDADSLEDLVETHIEKFL